LTSNLRLNHVKFYIVQQVRGTGSTFVRKNS
jgi:hypothetical protein